MNETLIRFSVAGVPLALPASAVLGVHDPVPLFPLPGLAPAVKGLGTVRGRPTTIIDPALLMAGTGAASSSGATGADAVLVLLAEPLLGLAIQVAPAVTTASCSSPVPPGPGPAARLIRGATRDGEGITVGILEPERILQALSSAGPDGA
jgi:chemotaxis signal transduction protein